MDADKNPATSPTANNPNDIVGSMSLDFHPTGEDVSPIHSESALASSALASQPQPDVDPNATIVHDVVNSEIGVATLLNRLKQSIASAKEFALFLKKRSTLEEEHSNGLKKLCRMTSESTRKPEHRHGTFLQSHDEVTAIHETMADNGAQFAMSLHQMHEDLLDLTSNIERGRKHWKTTGLAAEQRVADMEVAMRKSKTKYDALAEDYDRARTGDRQSGKLFGLKGPKSAAQHEEDLLRKVQAADADYASKVTNTQAQRAELVSKLRPEAVKALQALIKECDSALTLQMQKFASFNEKLLLSNGLNISPIKAVDQGSQRRSLREVVYAIDNEKDLSSYITSFAGKVPPRAPDIKYERHAVLNPAQQISSQRPSEPPSSFNSRQGPPQTHGGMQPAQPAQLQVAPGFGQGGSAATQQHERTFSQGPPSNQYNGGQTSPPFSNPGGQMPAYNGAPPVTGGAPQISTLPFQNPQSSPTNNFSSQQASATPYSQAPTSINTPHLSPLKPVFGLSLQELFDRDGSAVPMVVYQCIQAVDLFGLEVEGIYRLSGTASHITKIKAMFDNDSSKVDFRNPESFFHDVNSVAGLLKQFFRDLPDPLLTTEQYVAFINAAKTDDDILRRDSLHAIINSLPDPNYATLRALTLHLNRVLENSAINRMNASNLAIVFGPTLMGANTGPDIKEAGWQFKVIDTILNNTYQIFDDD
ncbi:Rho-GTPase-activating protein 7 [Phlyctema vagabunda]|uniref:Rho-GTPase-activating protein 7 n=1 Tax=Phlyctema vagabunda TaxID=108571 RepID=A0ABR4PAS3_9HELO